MSEDQSCKMFDDDKSSKIPNTNIPSNEEIINSLTENVQDSFKVTDSSMEGTMNSSSKINSESPISEIKDDGETVGSSNKDPEDDDIDEIELKKRDETLTEEEKKKLMDESQTYKNEGNEKFKEKEYRQSILLYTEGLKTCPLDFLVERSVLYSNRAACKHYLGLKESAILDCNKAVELNQHYLRAYKRRATLFEETDKLEQALEDYKKILELDYKNEDAIRATMRLPDQIKERNERLKEEMLGKLKDLGNMFLKPFGLSTQNFQMTQDPNTGGYSVNFKK